MHPRNRRRAMVAIALGVGMACCVAWVAAAPPAKSGVGSGLGLHFFTRKPSSEASNKPPTESGRVPIRTDVRKTAKTDVAKRSPATDDGDVSSNSKEADNSGTNARVPSLDKSSTSRNSVPADEVVELPESPDAPSSATVRVNANADTSDEEDEVVRPIPDDDDMAPEPLKPTERPATSNPSRVRPRPKVTTEIVQREQGSAQVQRKPIATDPEESISTPTVKSHTDVSAGLSISWKIDGDLTLGESRRALLVIQNSGGHDVTDVVARAVFSDALEVVRSIPERERLKQFSIWKLERIPAGTTQS
ncbi:MAG: hypothetical protein NT069_28175, partial [Planctomycetota bacterium]|nr:hypothetical protein [Planctomycetota bacterium]